MEKVVKIEHDGREYDFTIRKLRYMEVLDMYQKCRNGKGEINEYELSNLMFSKALMNPPVPIGDLSCEAGKQLMEEVNDYSNINQKKTTQLEVPSIQSTEAETQK